MPGSRCCSPVLIAFSRSKVPTRRASVAPTGRLTPETGFLEETSVTPRATLALHTLHRSLGVGGRSGKGSR
jgi:hypothetical protein